MALTQKVHTYLASAHTPPLWFPGYGGVKMTLSVIYSRQPKAELETPCFPLNVPLEASDPHLRIYASLGDLDGSEISYTSVSMCSLHRQCWRYSLIIMTKAGTFNQVLRRR